MAVLSHLQLWRLNWLVCMY